MKSWGTDKPLSEFEAGDWRLYCADWRDATPEEADHTITDPPYDERTHQGGRRGSGADGVSGPRPINFDPLDDVGGVALGLLEPTRRWLLAFCAVEMLGDYQRAAPDAYIRGGFWCKENPTPQFSGDRPGTPGEGIAIMHSRDRNDDGTLVEAPRWNAGGHAAVWHHSSEAHFSADRERVHETQKPLSLIVELVKNFTDPGELIWDPYAGSGTTGVAALANGRAFVGSELDEERAEVAAERLEAESRGVDLNAYRNGQKSLLEEV